MPIARTDWPLLLTLVERAMDVPPDGLEAWRAGLRLPPTLDHALRGLLEDRRGIETDGFLGELPVLPGLRLPRDDVDAPAERLRDGALIGPWRLVREIGEGGMSTVWLAERADGQVSRRAALKLPHAGPGQALLARRLQRERDILAALEHRHIARLYDVGVAGSGLPYLVMEYVEGDTLLAHADAQRMTITGRMACFRQVLAAVQYAHGRLVLHRDLKPANILVNGDGEVKLLDFGIAKILAPAGGERATTELTHVSGRRLTPAYASPEQLRSQPLGTASDVYSLGVVLYELLCGQRPFQSWEASMAQFEQAVLTREPRPLVRVELTADAVRARGSTAGALRKTLAGDIDAIVLKALAKAPERRYPSAEAFDADVARWLDGQPVRAHPPGFGYYAAKFVMRHRWAVASGTAAMLALTAASGVALVQARLAEQQAARAASVRDFLVAMFNETDPDRPDSQALTAKTLLENGHRRALADLAGTPDLQAELLRYIADAQANLSDRIVADRTYAEATETYRKARDDRSRLLAQLARVDNALALGRVDDAETLLKEAAAASAPFQADPAVSGTLLREQAYVAGFRRDWPAARDALQRYLALADRHAGMSPLERVQVLENLATASARSDDWTGAMGRIGEAFETLQRHPEIAVDARMDVVNYRQDIEYQWGRYAVIQRTSPADIRDCDRLLSPRSATCLKLKLRWHLARLRLGLPGEASAMDADLAPMLDPSSPRDQLAAASTIARASARDGPPGAHPERLQPLQRLMEAEGTASLDANFVLVGLNALVEIHVLAHEPDRALAWVAQAERLATSRRGVASAELHRLWALKGLALELQGRHASALAAMGALCEPGREPAGMTQVQDRLLSLNCVPALVADGRGQLALSLLQQALPVLRENLDEGSPTVQRALQWLETLRATHALPPMPDQLLTQFT